MIIFLTLPEVLDFHAEQIDLYGGVRGVRDMALLESALAQPCATFGGELLHSDIFEAASAYMFHIIQNHPFIDGNKRTGLAACLYFLGLNDIEIDVDPNELEKFVRAIASGDIAKHKIANFLRAHARIDDTVRHVRTGG